MNFCPACGHRLTAAPVAADMGKVRAGFLKIIRQNQDLGIVLSQFGNALWDYANDQYEEGNSDRARQWRDAARQVREHASRII